MIRPRCGFSRLSAVLRPAFFSMFFDFVAPSMRSTLRTALQLLRAESPSERERIVEQIGPEHPAVELFDALADAARNPDLPAPEVFDDEFFPGPNDVADYFDNPSNVSRAARLYEDACVRSDLLLAEIAACDEILNIRLQRPIRAAKNCRGRLYAISQGRNDSRAGERTSAESRRREPLRESLTREESREMNRTVPSEFSSPPEYFEDDFYPEKKEEKEPNSFFYTDDSEEWDANSRETSKNAEKSANDDPDGDLPTDKKKRGSWLEGLFLTFLIFGLILWLVPLAKNRLFQNSSADSEPPITESGKNALSAERPLPETRTAETPKLAASPELFSHPNGTANAPENISGEIGQEIQKAPLSEENGAWKPLTLPNPNEKPGEAARPAPERNRRAALMIPERNNNVFGK